MPEGLLPVRETFVTIGQSLGFGISSLRIWHEPKLTQKRYLIIVDTILDDPTIAHLPDVAEGKLNSPASSWNGTARSDHSSGICADKYALNYYSVKAFDELAHLPA